MVSKHQLRRQFRHQRVKCVNEGGVSESRARRWEAAMADHFVTLLKKSSGIWAGYFALPEEADPALTIARSSWLRWAYPRVQGSELEFYIPESIEGVQRNQWRIREPDPENSQKVPLESIEGFIVPGVAFDRWGRRLGRGQGYYDRALYGHEGVKVGLAWSSQIYDGDLPSEDHDVAMDVIVTENGVLRLFESEAEQ